jgi:hypothetical protein
VTHRQSAARRARAEGPETSGSAGAFSDRTLSAADIAGSFSKKCWSDPRCRSRAWTDEGPALTRSGGPKWPLSRHFGSRHLSAVRVGCRGRVSRMCHGHSRLRGRQGGLALRGQNSARSRLDPDAQGRPAEGSLQAPRPTIDGLVAAPGRAERYRPVDTPPPSPAAGRCPDAFQSKSRRSSRREVRPGSPPWEAASASALPLPIRLVREALQPVWLRTATWRSDPQTTSTHLRSVRPARLLPR